MSILVRLKNKLQDPLLTETKIREFDECMSLLKNENVELHKRVDQLEALYKTNHTIQPTHSLEEHIRELEQENGRLFAENQCQRHEYEQFLDQLTTMFIRTAAMQENIRQECTSIYHVIERLSNLTPNTFQINYPFNVIKEAKKRILNKSSELIRPSSSSSSSSSSVTTHCSVSTSNSWTLDLPVKHKDTQTQLTEEKQQQVLQRSETFIISKTPQEKLSSSLPVTVNDDNIKQRSITRTMVTTTTTSPTVRPSRLPSRCFNSKTQSSNTMNNNRSLSTQKVSKLPIRTTTSLNRQQTPIKKPNIPTPVVAKTKKDATIISNRSITSVNNSAIKKAIRPPSVTQLPSNKTRSRSITTTEKTNTNIHIPSSLNKCTKTTKEIVKSSDPIEQMNSTSSNSSIGEQEQQMNKSLPIVQDEGYSTWSSIDVKDDVIMNSIEKNGNDDRQKNIGLVKTWLDTSNRQCSKTPVKEVEIDKLEEFTQELSANSSFLCPFVRNRCSNGLSIPLPLTTSTFLHKDISLDSLDSLQLEDQTITSSSSPSSSSSSMSVFSRSETFEKLLLTQTLSNITDDLADSTSSSSSTFNMSEYIEDHFIDPDDSSSSNSSSETSSSFETSIIINKTISLKPEKRLLFPGLLNRLIFSRRILSDSDLQRKEFYINENENQFHVYHSNIINEHSVEVNLINTYGSDTELHVWSHDCAEQRRFLNERQQQQEQEQEQEEQLSNQIEENQSNSYQQLAIERQILLQQIYEYPWLLQDNDLDRTTTFLSTNVQQPLVSPISDLIVPSHNPDFYQLCTLTNSSSFVISYDSNARHTTASTTSSVL